MKDSGSVSLSECFGPGWSSPIPTSSDFVDSVYPSLLQSGMINVGSCIPAMWDQNVLGCFVHPCVCNAPSVLAFMQLLALLHVFVVFYLCVSNFLFV